VAAEWQAFFSALAGVTALVFVVLLAVLQVTSIRWRGTALKEVAAVLALLALLIPLLASLVALMPGAPWRVGYLVMGGVGVGALVWHAATYLRCEQDTDAFDDRQVQWGLPVSLGVYFSLVAFSCSTAAWSVYVVAGLSIWLVFAGTAGVWLLLSRTTGDRPPVTGADRDGAAPTVSR
jgi:hypothetical protein